MSALPHLDAAAIRAFGFPAATEALDRALRDGFDPAGDLARTGTPFGDGDLLLMPSASSDRTGLKVITITPDNPSRGLPRIQGVYVLFDRATGAPVLVADGAEVTNLRTPAVSMVVVRRWLPDRPIRAVVIGAGPQARAHAEALRAIAADRIADLTMVARTAPDASDPWCAAHGVRPETITTLPRLLAEADLVLCATTASEPLFDSAPVRAGALVVAVGSHTPDARELDSALLGRAQVVVEDVATALREAGDVVLAIADGAVRTEDLVPVAEVVTGRTPLASDLPIVYKTTGMSWEDLVIVSAIDRA